MTFEARRIDANAPFVRAALSRYLAKWHIHDPGNQAEKSWWGLFHGERLALAYAYLVRDDGGIELTDVYLEPSRLGFAAVRFAGQALIDGLAAGVVPYCVATTFAKNTRALKWIKTYLGRSIPDAAIFVFPGATLDHERRALIGVG